MVRGFYTLGSGILTQSRILSGVSNNLANVDTPGYKKKEVSTSTFGDILISRVDSKITPIGTLGAISTADKTNVIHSEGTLKTTDRTLDFAVQGEGFFGVQSQNGLVYTRDGSFSVDNEGYLTLNNVGRVVGQNGAIKVGTDNFTADSQGNITVNGNKVGTIAVYNFADYNNLKITQAGMYTAAGGATLMQNPSLLWKSLEGSNVDSAEEMTDALAAQRNLQSCSQAVKMYDQVLQKAVTDIGKL
jgi:flagellar basal-body rod protein FlgF